MTEEQQRDLDLLRAEIQQRKVDCFNYCTYILDLDESLLTMHGHKSKGEAVVWSIKNAQKEVKRLIQQYEKKYPDQEDR
jgi:hypothetical protein